MKFRSTFLRFSDMNLHAATAMQVTFCDTQILYYSKKVNWNEVMGNFLKRNHAAKRKKKFSLQGFRLAEVLTSFLETDVNFFILFFNYVILLIRFQFECFVKMFGIFAAILRNTWSLKEGGHWPTLYFQISSIELSSLII